MSGPLQPAESPGFLLWRATLRWQRSIAAVLAPFELTHVQFVLLACAWWANEHDELPNQAALARQAGTDVRMTSQVLRALEARGLLERRPDGDDARARTIVATRKGKALAPKAIAAVEAADAEFFAAIPKERAIHFLSVLAGG
ncbi:MAG TPA: MarR family winged helix-turn-helix transcriptional regulator [Solirubrobacterales bacterium]|jgi:DNA-binding MarR family transcriptional regulator|nr:MarR family winged helix-turn-helix transcriptional regulator [Solirubrobacterales bacterium]